MNKVIIMGRTAGPAELKTTVDGSRVARLRIVSNRKWKDQATGAMREEATWHTVTVWNGLADFAARYCPKGREVLVEGRLRNNEWEKDGVKMYGIDIVGEVLTGLGPVPHDGGGE